MKPVVALAIGVTVLAAQTGKPVPHSVTAVRHWSLGGVTRIAVEVSGEFQYRSDRLQNPDRIYYDILNARPNFDSKRLYTEDLVGAFVKRRRSPPHASVRPVKISMLSKETNCLLY